MRIPEPWLRKSTGTWHVVIDGKQKYLGKDEAKARAKFDELMGNGHAGNATIREIISAYSAWARKNVAATTWERRRPILESFSASLPSAFKGSALRAMHIQRWIDANDKKKLPTKGRGKTGEKKVSDKPLSPTTISDYITLIKGVMKWARGMGYVNEDRVKDMPKPARRVRQDFLPVDTWPKVLALATDEPFRDYLTVMLASGARPVEMGKFEASHLHGSRFILPIEKSKGKKRSRVVYLPDEALAIVTRLAGQYPIGKLFRNSDGEPWNHDSIKGRFSRLKRLLKLPNLTATTLRHSFAHHRLTSGQDALTVSKLMGHVDTRMIATRYGHLDSNVEYMQAAANAAVFPSVPIVAPSPSA